jgi:hypothetical protein
MIKTRVTGIDAAIRSFDRKRDDVEQALTEGTEEAGDYLIECIEDKFGVYQPGWKKLKYETIYRKKRHGAGANATKPLIEFADMMFSFFKITSVKTRKHVVHILSDDPKIIHHIYGAPSAGVPKRDPVRPTVKEENEKCLEIIKDAVRRIL